MANDIDGHEREDGELEEEQPMTFEQAVAAWQPAPSLSPFSNMAISRDLAQARAVLEFDVTAHGPRSTEELMAKVHLLHQDNLISATEKASASKFPHKETSEFYSPKQSTQYNDKMNSCRALENLLQSHNAGGMSMQMRCELGTVQKQIAQEALVLSLTATVGFAAGRKFEQVVVNRQEESFEAVYMAEIEQARAAQVVADAVLAESAAKRLKASPHGSWSNNAWWQGSPSMWGEGVWQAGSPGPGRKRGPKSGSPQAGKASAPASAPGRPAIVCYNCGVAGHKSDACQAPAFSSGFVPGPAVSTKGWGNWQAEAPSYDQTVTGWGSEWDEESHQNARPDWSQWPEGASKGKGKAGGKAGGKQGSGKGWPSWRDGGASQSPKGGGKGGSWSAGGRGKGYAWSKGS